MLLDMRKEAEEIISGFALKMAACISGPVSSSLVYDQINSAGDQEGLLLGRVVQDVTDTISDSQINNYKVETSIHIFSYIPCPRSHWFYDRRGSVVEKEIDALIKDRKKDVVGWYRFRRNSALKISLREKAVHENLLKVLKHVQPESFLFFLCTSSASTNLSTHTYDHVVYKLISGVTVPVSLSVMNLGDTTQSEYKSHSAVTINPQPGMYQSALIKFQDQFYDTTGRMREVTLIQELANNLIVQLEKISSLIIDEEEELEKLESNVRCHQERLQENTQKLQPFPHLDSAPKPEPTVPPPAYRVCEIVENVNYPMVEKMHLPETLNDIEMSNEGPVQVSHSVKQLRNYNSPKAWIDGASPLQAELVHSKNHAVTNQLSDSEKTSKELRHLSKDQFSFIDSVMHNAKQVLRADQQISCVTVPLGAEVKPPTHDTVTKVSTQRGQGKLFQQTAPPVNPTPLAVAVERARNLRMQSRQNKAAAAAANLNQAVTLIPKTDGTNNEQFHTESFGKCRQEQVKSSTCLKAESGHDSFLEESPVSSGQLKFKPSSPVF